MVAEKIRNQESARPDSINFIPGDPEKNSFNERSKKGIPLSEVDREKFDDIAKKYSIKTMKYI